MKIDVVLDMCNIQHLEGREYNYNMGDANTKYKKTERILNPSQI